MSKGKITDKIMIEVKNVHKVFKIPHEKSNSLKSSALSILNLKKPSYSVFEALNDISFDIREGEFFGIIGRNGSGKSTLLKMLAGIYQPDSGKIKTSGRISPFLELGVGFNPELTGRENVYLNGAILGLSKKEIDEKYDEIVEFSELEEFMDQKLKNYSSGMQVRLAFAVSIKAHAEILLIDEVLAVGDSNFQKKCFDVFREFKKQGKTIVFVSHGMSSIKEFCDRVALIHEHRLVGVLDPDTAVSEYEKINLDSNNQTPLQTSSDVDKPISITEVSVLNGAGKKETHFCDNDEVAIRIKFKNNNNIEKAHFQVSVYDDTDAYCFATNTLMDKKEFDLKRNEITFSFNPRVLLTGNYYISIMIFDCENYSNTYDLWVKKVSFKKNSDNKASGIFWLDHEWKS